jgi:L-ascorbate metabolism protein UlaG (beta-lactamase superfamily)
MKIELVNHASVIVEHEGTRVMTDPWHYGPAFNDGWDLIAATAFARERFSEIDYIWVSHEHPDHFSPRVLLDIPEAVRREITALYRVTKDKKVVRFCEKKGFAVRELEDDERVRLGPGFDATCRAVPLYDSWLMLEAAGARVLNLNDAVVHTARDLDKLAGELGPIDVLLTQFSFAAWRGNPQDRAMREADAERKLEILARQIQVLRPRFVIPFASFAFFCHTENFFTNDAANPPKRGVDTIVENGAQPVLLYPGDTWTVGEAHANASALERWATDYADLAARPRRTSDPVALADLTEAARVYIERIYAANDRRVLALLHANPVLPALRPIEIRLWDLDICVRFSFEHGLEVIGARDRSYDLRMASDSLNFILRQPWGIDTLTVNGRFYADRGGLKRLVTTFGVDLLNNAGIKLSPAFLVDFSSIGFLLRVLLKKLWSMRAQSDR